MKLLYFATKGFCQNQNWVEFNFDSNLRFSKQGNELHVEYTDVLPQGFFSSRTKWPESPVESASVVVGGNGVGKTTLAYLLSLAFKENVSDAYLEMLDEAERVDLVNRRDYIAVLESFGSVGNITAIQIATNLQSNIHFGAVEDSIKARFKFEEERIALNSRLKMIYHSPVFTFHEAVEENDDTVVDLSSRRKSQVRDEEIESRDCTGCRVEGMERALLEENKRILAFLLTIVSEDMTLKFPIPREVNCIVEEAAIDHVLNAFSGVMAKGSEWDPVKWLLHSQDSFAKMLVAYVIDAFGCPTVPCEGAQFQFASEQIEEVFKSIFIPFAVRLQEFNQDDSSIQENDNLQIFRRVLYKPCFDAYSNVLAKLHDFVSRLESSSSGNQYGLFGNDRSLEGLKAGVDMFFLIAERICSHHDEYALGAMRFSLRNEDDVRFIGKVNDYYGRCRDRWSISYLHLMFGLSAGEMSFVSLFSRLHGYFEYMRREVGDEEGDYILFLDESETTLHPNLQRQIVTYLIEFFEALHSKCKTHIIFATHSPVLLSDIPIGNVVRLQRNRDGASEVVTNDGVCSFAANIFDLYKDAFFLDEGAMGAFAAEKVKELLHKLIPQKPEGMSGEEYQKVLLDIKVDDDDLKVAKLIGDPFLSHCVWGRLDELSKIEDAPEDELPVTADLIRG